MGPKSRRGRIVLVLLAVPVFLAAVCLLDSLRYPRIARSAYWRRPILLVRATLARLFPGKGVPKRTVLAHARQMGRRGDLGVRLLYLPDLPTDDKTIKARVFHLIAKSWGHSKEQLFWVVTPKRPGGRINDGSLAYEYRAGRLVCAQEHSRVGEYAVER